MAYRARFAQAGHVTDIHRDPRAFRAQTGPLKTDSHTSYVRDHGAAYCLDSQALDYSLSTPYFDGLRRALDAVATIEQSLAARLHPSHRSLAASRGVTAA